MHVLEFVRIFQFKVDIGEETLVKFSGVQMGEACSIVLRGATEQILDEAERSLHDALCVLTSTVKVIIVNLYNYFKIQICPYFRQH